MGAADVVAADGLYELDVAEHRRGRSSVAVLGVGVVAVYALEPHLLAVEPKRLVVRDELAYAEPRRDGAERASRDCHAVEIRALGTPQLERRHFEARAPVGKADGLCRAAVERNRRVERSGKRPLRLKRKLDRASLVVARPDDHAVKLRFRMLQL